jgi:hypothetical protein
MKRKVPSCVLFFLYVSIAACAYGQKAQLSLDEILERHAQALGGRDKINAVHSVIQHFEYREGSFVIPDAFIARMRPYYKTIGDPKDRRIEINEGYDGSAWEYYADPGVVIRTVGAAAGAARHGTELIDSLVEYKSIGTRIELAGRDTFGGQPAYKLRVTFADAFEKDVFIDPVSFLIVGDRRSAPIHAFGTAVLSENRIADYRPVNGVLFPFSIKEVEIATGREMNSNTTHSVVVNARLDPDFFSPPQFQRTPLQQMLEQLYAERADPVCVMWTYRGFRAANPDVETRDGVEFIAYQMVKMGDFRGPIELLTANALDYPKSASAEFGLGRAYKAAGNLENARIHFQKALEMDPNFRKASDGLNALR